MHYINFYRKFTLWKLFVFSWFLALMTRPSLWLLGNERMPPQMHTCFSIARFKLFDQNSARNGNGSGKGKIHFCKRMHVTEHIPTMHLCAIYMGSSKTHIHTDTLQLTYTNTLTLVMWYWNLNITIITLQFKGHANKQRIFVWVNVCVWMSVRLSVNWMGHFWSFILQLQLNRQRSVYWG